VLWALGAGLLVAGRASALLGVLFLWQGSVYACAPFMAWLNQHTELSAQLERRRRSEWMRERRSMKAPILVGVGTAFAVVGGVAAMILLGALGSGPLRHNPFQVAAPPPASPSPSWSLSPVVVPSVKTGPSSSRTPVATASASATPSVSTSPSSTPTPSATSSHSPSSSQSASPSPSPSATSSPGAAGPPTP
jgi:hypothetical protein